LRVTIWRDDQGAVELSILTSHLTRRAARVCDNETRAECDAKKRKKKEKKEKESRMRRRREEDSEVADEEM
jgi:hypothetical protein